LARENTFAGMTAAAGSTNLVVRLDNKCAEISFDFVD
jgi:hypothetical protein